MNACMHKNQLLKVKDLYNLKRKQIMNYCFKALVWWLMMDELVNKNGLEMVTHEAGKLI